MSSAEPFQDYMSGGVRRGVRRGVKRVVRSAPKPVQKRKPVRPAMAKRPHNKMASLFGGFFESLEGFADAVKEEKKKEMYMDKKEMYADDKNPMQPLADAAKKGGAKKVKKAVAKKALPKKGLGKKAMMGGYEEEQFEESEQSAEEFIDIKDAVKQVKELISGGYYRPRPMARRPASAPARPRRVASPSPRRAVPKPVPKRRPAARRVYM